MCVERIQMNSPIGKHINIYAEAVSHAVFPITLFKEGGLLPPAQNVWNYNIHIFFSTILHSSQRTADPPQQTRASASYRAKTTTAPPTPSPPLAPPIGRSVHPSSP